MVKRVAQFLLVAGSMLTLGACADRATYLETMPPSVEQRYPLTASAQARRVDVRAFTPSSSDRQRLAQASVDYLRHGSGNIVIFVPQSGQGALSSGNWVKQELIAQGIAPHKIQWDARDMPQGLVRVAFSSRGRGIGQACTNLNEDVQQFEDGTSYLNRETVNFGCAYQSNMRLQADNPQDFLRPRPEGGMDPVRTVRAIRDHRTGTNNQPPPPSTGALTP
jgi:pilus biogenesis lipoprotein CpaD